MTYLEYIFKRLNIWGSGVKLYIVPFHTAYPHPLRFFTFTTPLPLFLSLPLSHLHRVWPVASHRQLFYIISNGDPTPTLSWDLLKPFLFSFFFFWAQSLNNLSSPFSSFFSLPSNPNSRKKPTRSTP